VRLVFGVCCKLCCCKWLHATRHDSVVLTLTLLLILNINVDVNTNIPAHSHPPPTHFRIHIACTPPLQDELDSELDNLLERELDKEAQLEAEERQRAREELEEAEDAAEAKRRYEEQGGWLGKLLGRKVRKTPEELEAEDAQDDAYRMELEEHKMKLFLKLNPPPVEEKEEKFAGFAPPMTGSPKKSPKK